MMTELARRVMANEMARTRGRHYVHGTIPFETINAIRKAKGTTQMIAARFGTSRQHVGQIRLGKTRVDS